MLKSTNQVFLSGQGSSVKILLSEKQLWKIEHVWNSQFHLRTEQTGTHCMSLMLSYEIIGSDDDSCTPNPCYFDNECFPGMFHF